MINDVEIKTKVIEAKVDSLSSTKPEDFIETVPALTKEIDHYFFKRQKVCLGEFSTIILSESGESSKGDKKLSDQEREVCLRNLKRLQLKYVNNLFELKKKYIIFLHEKRLEELDLAHKEEIKRLR